MSEKKFEMLQNYDKQRCARDPAAYRRVIFTSPCCHLIESRPVVTVTAGLLAMLSVAAAADLPRKEPPPAAAAPIGKYPVGKYPVGKYPVGKYPQPVVTKG
jgi:hypothetical protein